MYDDIKDWAIRKWLVQNGFNDMAKPECEYGRCMRRNNYTVYSLKSGLTPEKRRAGLEFTLYWAPCGLMDSRPGLNEETILAEWRALSAKKEEAA